jgi:hypothetical protein
MFRKKKMPEQKPLESNSRYESPEHPRLVSIRSHAEMCKIHSQLIHEERVKVEQERGSVS